jgi:hypothetical protein
MTATVLVREAHGATPTLTDITGANTLHVTSDTYYASGTADTVPIPAAGSNYSFWKHHRLDATVTPTTGINNVNWFTDGINSAPAGVTWLCQSANAGALAGYRQAGLVGTEVVGTTGAVLNITNHTGLTAAPVDPFTFTSAAPLALAGSITNPSTGPFADYVVSQMIVASTCTTTGAVPTEGGFFSFDET